MVSAGQGLTDASCGDWTCLLQAGAGRDRMGRDGMGGTGRDGTGWDGMGRDRTGRDGTGRDGMGWDGTRRGVAHLLDGVQLSEGGVGIGVLRVPTVTMPARETGIPEHRSCHHSYRPTSKQPVRITCRGGLWWVVRSPCHDNDWYRRSRPVHNTHLSCCSLRKEACGDTYAHTRTHAHTHTHSTAQHTTTHTTHNHRNKPTGARTDTVTAPARDAEPHAPGAAHACYCKTTNGCAALKRGRCLCERSATEAARAQAPSCRCARICAECRTRNPSRARTMADTEDHAIDKLGRLQPRGSANSHKKYVD